MHMVPGDPLSNDKAMTEESREALNKKYGFDKPLYEQYFIFLKEYCEGDFGVSFTRRSGCYGYHKAGVLCLCTIGSSGNTLCCLWRNSVGCNNCEIP